MSHCSLIVYFLKTQNGAVERDTTLGERDEDLIVALRVRDEQI